MARVIRRGREIECPKCWNMLMYNKDDIISYDLEKYFLDSDIYPNFKKDPDLKPFALREYKLILLDDDYIICPKCGINFAVGPNTGSSNIVNEFNMDPPENKIDFYKKLSSFGILDKVLHYKFDQIHNKTSQKIQQY